MMFATRKITMCEKDQIKIQHMYNALTPQNVLTLSSEVGLIPSLKTSASKIRQLSRPDPVPKGATVVCVLAMTFSYIFPQ